MRERKSKRFHLDEKSSLRKVLSILSSIVAFQVLNIKRCQLDDKPSLKQVVEEYGLKVGQEKSKTEFSHFKVPYIVEEELPDIKTDAQSQVVLGTLRFQV